MQLPPESYYEATLPSESENLETSLDTLVADNMDRRLPLQIPSLRTTALLSLLIFGLLGSFAFHSAMTDMQVTFTSTAIQPGDDPALVARASPSVGDLGGRLEGRSSKVRQPVERAVQTGSYTGNVLPELSIVLDGMDVKYVVYDGSYYRWNATMNETTTFVAMEMTPTEPMTVLDTVSTPYRTASSEVKEVIDTGSVTGRNIFEPGVYTRGDTYYAVAPESAGALAANLLEAFLGSVLTPIGRGFVAVALGIMVFRYREVVSNRVLTVRRALAVAALGVPVALVGTAFFESGSLTRFVTSPAGTFVVSAGVVAGVLVHQRRWAHLIGWTVFVGILSVGASALVLGVVGVIFGGLRLLAGLLAGMLSLGFGAWFALDRGNPPADRVDD